jgi:hypothetical protein
MLRHCEGLSPSLEISTEVIGLDNLPDFANLTWSTTISKRIYLYPTSFRQWPNCDDTSKVEYWY